MESAYPKGHKGSLRRAGCVTGALEVNYAFFKPIESASVIYQRSNITTLRVQDSSTSVSAPDIFSY